MIDEASSRTRAASTTLSCHIPIREKSHPAIRFPTFCGEASPALQDGVGDSEISISRRLLTVSHNLLANYRVAADKSSRMCRL
jgi:hypothetical protein